METNRINEAIKKLYPRDFRATRRRNRFLYSLDENKRLIIITLSICLIVPAIASVFYYNKFVSLHTSAVTASAQIKAYQQKRSNIITNLTKMVVDYAEHERTMYIYMADVRKDIIPQKSTLLEATEGLKNAGVNVKDFSKFEGLLSKFMAWSESYPDLKLNKNFQDFMKEIVAIETNIADARMVYNIEVNMYTTYRRKFPNIFFAWVFGFSGMDFYQGDAVSQKFKEVAF